MGRLRPIPEAWLVGPDRDFAERLRKVGFDVDEVRVHAHGSKGARHVNWFAQRG